MENRQKNVPLYSLSKFKCECIFTDALGVTTQHLSEIRKILDTNEFKNDREYKKVLSKLEKSIDELKRQNLEHLKFRREYARELVEMIKQKEINVGPTQQNLQTLPYLRGKKRTRELELKKTKK